MSHLGPCAVLAAALLAAPACQASRVGCARDGDCHPGWACVDEQCVKLCNANRDCWPPMVICEAGLCVLNRAQPCTHDLECPAVPGIDGCHEGECTCAAAGAPCPAGDVCTSGGCVTLAGSGASAASPVAGGLVGTSEHYRLALGVAPRSPVGRLSSEHYELRLGVSAR